MNKYADRLEVLSAVATIREFAGKDPVYHYVRYLGEGAFGRVDLVRRREDDKEFACKVIPISTANYKDLIAIVREITSLRLLRGCLGCVEWEEDISMDTSKNQLHLHMKFCNNSSLHDLINKFRGEGTSPSESFVMRILEDLVNGIRSFHRIHIVHRDIKPRNNEVLNPQVKVANVHRQVMLHTHKAGENVPDMRRPYPNRAMSAYYVDFGLSKYSNGAASLHTCNQGTLVYMAPESVGLNPRYSSKSDVFSLGCVAYELCELRRAYRRRDKTSVPAMSGPYSEALKSLIRDMMSINPSSRPDTEALHRRFAQLNARSKAADGASVDMVDV